MAYVQSFTVSQTALNPALVIFTDTSTGTDGAITQRRITITDSQNNYIVVSGTTTNYNQWPLATNPISLNLLTTDLAVSIKVDWLSVTNVVLYTLTNQFCLSFFNKAFMYYLAQQESLTPNIVQDTNYYNNKAMFWTTIVSADNAVEIGDDIAASQNQLNVGTNMRLQESLYF